MKKDKITVIKGKSTEIKANEKKKHYNQRTIRVDHIKSRTCNIISVDLQTKFRKRRKNEDE